MQLLDIYDHDILLLSLSLLWLPNRAGNYILQLWFLLLLSFFLACSQQLQISCLPYFHTWCGLSAYLECRSEMCCMRLAENTGCKNLASAHHHTTLSCYIFTTKACINNWKKTCNSNISSTCPHNMVNFGLLTAEVCSECGAPQQISTGFASWLCYCVDVAQRRSTKVCTMFGHLLGWCAICAFLGALAP